MPGEQRSVGEITRREWRQLGFHYNRNEAAKEWILTGSRSGLLRLRHLLLEYCEDPRNALESEHEHYGPYLYFKIMTWREAGIDRDGIYGTRDDLRRLALLIEKRIARADPGTDVLISDDYAPSDYRLRFSVREDGFDPSSADELLV